MAEQKQTIELEYLINTSPFILYNRLSTASGLAEWFADSVTADGKVFTFTWSKADERAEQTLRKDCKSVRFQWLDQNDENAWFEFQIHVDELTGDVALIIVDHVEPDDVNDTIELWNKQVETLKRCIGSLQ